MRISFSATNPCHLHPLAQATAKLGAGGCYYSGYPRWKLPASERLKVRTHSAATLAVYGLLKFVPERWRPGARDLFLWQDRSFDRWVGAHLEDCEFIHGIPGQCLHTFRAAKRLGMQTVLNHATGPVREWVRIMEPEYARAGLALTEVCPYDDAYFSQADEEYALTDWHCAASTIVRDQLIEQGIEESRIWLVPYGADPHIFFADAEPQRQDFRVVFAGQVGLRKNIKTLLAALEISGRDGWTVDFFGAVLSECSGDLSGYRGHPQLRFHGPLPQRALAEEFRRGSVLVLPSLEEGFGLVVPQALNCGMPCIVSDRVGAKDLIRHRDNGSIFAALDADALARELTWWAENPRRIDENHTWELPAQTLLGYSRSQRKYPASS